jgi:integrase
MGTIPAMKVRKLDRRHKGYTRVEWVLDYYAGGRRIRKWFKSKSQAEAEADSLKEQKRSCGEAWTDLAPAERNDLMVIYMQAKQENITLRQVWEAFKNGKLDSTPMERCTLQRAIAETLEWRRGENLRERYLKELENYLRRFASGRMELFIDKIGVSEIQEWFEGRNEALSTKRANIGRLGSLFDVAWKRGYIKENPCLKLPTVKLRQEAPKILTPDEAKRVLTICQKKTRPLLPYVVLGMFAGIRPEEMEKLTWGDVDLKHGTIKIDVATSKTNRRRIVTLHDTAREWLKICKSGAPAKLIVPTKTTLRRYRRNLRDGAKLEWAQDILRHTAGSYLLALHKNTHEVSAMLGNSARILERHYKDLVNATDCKTFWALTPSAIGKEKRGKR